MFVGERVAVQERSNMLRRIFIFCAVLLAVNCRASGPAAQTQQPAATAATDAEYRKFDELLSFLRTRNARDYAISSPKGIDEGRYVSIGGIEQWITIRGEDRSNP